VDRSAPGAKRKGDAGARGLRYRKPMRGAAFFDLDGTLLTVNSANLWIRRERRLGHISNWQLARAALLLGGYRLGVLDMNSALRAALATLRGVSEESIRQQTHEWWREEVRPFVAPGAREVLDQHRRDGEPLVLLTSSSRYAAEMAIDEFKLDAALFQRYAVSEGKFTGEPLRPICYGAGKVETAEAWARERDIDLSASSFYTDSVTDLPMLERVAHPFAVQPDPRLRRIARARGWPILSWTK
jgi:HAD superfamily hydrolase (TIGR01490 family)